MKKHLSIFIFISTLFLLLILASKLAHVSQAAPATHVVISEVQTGIDGASSSDFVELYNPTNSAVNLGDMRLAKRTSTGSTDTNIIAFTSAHIIPAHGFFLWCNTSLAESLSCDASSSATVSENNSIVLREDPADTGIIIDAVTIGTPANPIGEGTALENPVNGGSIERKANSASTVVSMTTGADQLAGNAEDTNNNASDFIQRPLSQAQNTLSNFEPLATISDTPIPSQSPTLTMTPTITHTPTSIPSQTPTLTTSPSPIPTTSATPTPSHTPSQTPTQTPTSTPEKPILIPVFQLVCTEKAIHYKVFGITYTITYPSCKLLRLK